MRAPVLALLLSACHSSMHPNSAGHDAITEIFLATILE